MDQLYEAMPIPSFSDEELEQHDSHDVVSGLDISAHGSFSEGSLSSSFSDCSGRRSDGEGEARTSKKSSAAQHNSHHRVFTTSSSPEELYLFLADLLQLAEQLQVRLCTVIPAGPSPSRPRSATSPPPAEWQASNRGNSAFYAGEKTKSAGQDSTAQTTSPSASEGRRDHAFVRAAPCHGAAKLRSRLRKETENLRRAVDGLRAAGCTGNRGSSTGEPIVSPAAFSAAAACAQCNSIAHFEGVVTCVEREHGVTGVYVPMSACVGCPQRRASTSVLSVPISSPAGAAAVAHDTRGTVTPVFADDVSIEVDVVSCSEHRWIKVKTATARNLELEAAALEANGSIPFTDMLLALCERAGRACLPHRRVAHVAVVLLHPPPVPLKAFFEAHRIAWAVLTSKPARAPRLHAHHSPVTAWLPPSSFAPRFVCLDTTALVTLCSQSCFVDAMPLAVRLQRLSPFSVLQEQQRKEAAGCAAVTAVMEPALRTYTRWCTPHALNEDMRGALLREDEVQRSVPPGADDSNLESRTREARVPPSLLHTVDLSWLPPLREAADADHHEPSNTLLDESTLLIELSEQQAREKERRPNWLIADITYEEFRWILETIAGPAEIARATRLLTLVTVVSTGFLRACMLTEQEGAGLSAAEKTGDVVHPPKKEAREPQKKNRDCAGGAAAAEVAAQALFSPSASSSPPPLFSNVEYLRLSGKVSLRNKIVFGFADAVEAIILTSNEQLCHAARAQGVCIEACFHPSRSLTEQKVYRLRRRPGPGKPPAII
ncbi:hypothetical protein ABB37_05272 [Leptomonas pyrrhocoris]|uniref:DUF1308 domain-containing protein n=1 Tax=Leptomonas pyrrhocoris TaxID=157538 RepID=A0A0N0VEV5_LEPPY|nr:hypothetical protein ABB37_05272 [Leptomonas pyrrhocoris]KPA79432.1 hypothetical protein ABB37_05272 [Leptomonas pyrrhocoris]|eukprot:XP_015657871.1 hypothetical protein ABB37_05272 [Leptomonas pyrrhocoris]